MTTKTGGEANVYLWHHGNGEGVRQQLHVQGRNSSAPESGDALAVL
jgi:hypothetical protein